LNKHITKCEIKHEAVEKLQRTAENHNQIDIDMTMTIMLVRLIMKEMSAMWRSKYFQQMCFAHSNKT